MKTEKFEILSEYLQNQLRERALEAVEYFKATKSSTVVALDKSGRIAGLLFREAWRKKMGSKKIPRVYFLNPDMVSELPEKAAPYVQEILERARGRPSRKLPTKFPFANYKRLMLYKNPSLFSYLSQNPSHNILILDEMIMSGSTIRRAQSFIESVGGVRKIHNFALANHVMPWMSPERVGVDEYRGKTIPADIFDWGDGEFKTSMSREAKQLRKEIKMLFRE